jgi:hypothetical protein
MSMHIDSSKPLTPEARAYLEGRGNHAEIARIDSINGVTNPPAPGEGDGTGPAIQPLMTSEQRAAERDNLLKRLAELDAGTEQAEDGDAEEGEPYEVWTAEELKNEIDRRNEGRAAEAQISKAGNKAQLAERLYADDEVLRESAGS